MAEPTIGECFPEDEEAIHSICEIILPRDRPQLMGDNEHKYTILLDKHNSGNSADLYFANMLL